MLNHPTASRTSGGTFNPVHSYSSRENKFRVASTCPRSSSKCLLSPSPPCCRCDSETSQHFVIEKSPTATQLTFDTAHLLAFKGKEEMKKGQTPPTAEQLIPGTTSRALPPGTHSAGNWLPCFTPTKRGLLSVAWWSTSSCHQAPLNHLGGCFDI